MSDLVSLVVGPIIDRIKEIAVSLIQEEFLSVYGLKDDVEKLSSNLTAIQAVLEDAEEKQIKERHLRDWLGKLKNAALDAEDMLDSIITETSLWKRKQQVRRIPIPLSVSKIPYQYDAAQKIKGILARLSEISEEKRNFHLSTNIDVGTPHNHQQTGSFVDTGDVLGREDDREKIIELLMSDNSSEDGNVSIIPIVGMGGLGKTTIAQLVFNDERVKGHFELSRMWTCVTVDFNFTRILREIIESYTKTNLPNDLSPSLIESRFRDLLNGKRYLIVLDDVWTEDYKDWAPLVHLLKLGQRGSKVLVTTRSQKVAEVIGTGDPYHLDYLRDDECRSLFRKIAFKNGDLPGSLQKELEDIGEEIIAKCNRLPLAVKAMAGLLRGNIDVEKWKRILKSHLWELEDRSFNYNTPNILPALKLSYNHLPSHLKQCFVFCSLFPKSFVFVKKDLVKLWMAAAFIQCRGQDSKEKIGAEYFDELLVRSFFQPVKIHDKVQHRMHDLIHDLAQSISNPYYCQVKDDKLCSSLENFRHVSLLCQDVEQPCLHIANANNSTKLRTLMLPGEHLKNLGQVLEKLFDSLRHIRVLDLSSSTLLELPGSIESLKLLRYLDLSRTEIKELPNTICNLYNLQTLKLSRCLWLFALPKDLGNLVNLCHLELDEMFWFNCIILPPNIGNLTNLRNLHAFKVSHQPGYGIRELKDLAYLTETLHVSNLENAENAGEAKLNEKEALQKVALEWNSREVNSQDEAAEERVLADLQPHSNLKELQISHYKGASFPAWMIDGSLKNLVTISLNRCSKCKILSLDQLPHLQALYIKHMQELEILQCPSKFLRRLQISHCERLSELTNFLPNLAVLKIKKCVSLKALPISPSLMFLILVDNLALENWLEARGQSVSRNDQGQLVIHELFSYDHLLEMKVVNCPKLQALPSVFAPQKLEISRCELLTALIPPEHARRLQHLALDTCNGTLLGVIPTTNSLSSTVFSNISNLQYLPKWPYLPGLKVLYIHNCKDLVSLSEEGESSFQSLTSLVLLSIQGCQKLVTLLNTGLPTTLEYLSIGSCSSLQSLGPSETLKCLTSLKNLYIENCPLVQSFPGGGLPTSLQHLSIQKCPLLTERCQKDVGPEWPTIMNIPDLEIDSQTQLPGEKTPSAPLNRHFVRRKFLMVILCPVLFAALLVWFQGPLFSKWQETEDGCQCGSSVHAASCYPT